MKPEIIEILVRGVCVRRGFLLVCRNRKRGHIFLPGGHIEFGEDARAALAREMREELGRRCRVGRFLGAAEHIFRRKGRRICEINLIFQMTLPDISGRQPLAAQERKIEFDWLAVRDLPGSELQPWALRRALPAWLCRQRGGGWVSTYEGGGQVIRNP